MKIYRTQVFKLGEQKKLMKKIVVYLLDDIKKAKRQGGHLLGGQSSAAKKFSTTFWSRPPLKRWKVFIIFLFWVRLRVTKFNCGETKGRLLWRYEPGEVYKFKFKYQILSIKYHYLGDASPERYWRISSFLSFAKPCGLGGGVMERWKGVDVYISIFVYLENFCGLGG